MVDTNIVEKLTEVLFMGKFIFPMSLIILDIGAALVYGINGDI